MLVTKKETQRQIMLIFFFIAIFSLSMGIWENYKSVWLEANGLTVSNLSLIISGGLFITALFAILISFIFKKILTKNIIMVCCYLKFIIMVALIFVFQKNVPNSITFILFILDTICGQLVVFSMYPLLAHHVKNDKLYSKRKLIEYAMQDFGLAIAMLVLGFYSANLFEYNLLLIVSCVFVAISCVLCVFFKEKKKRRSKVPFVRIFKDKIFNLYIWVYIISSNVSYYTILGMQALLLKNLGGLSINQTSIFLLIASVCGDVFGYLALWKLTPKNNYLTILLKFGTRLVFYCLVIAFSNSVVLLIAVFISLLISRAFENITDGPYINRFPANLQFAATNYRYAGSTIGKAIGIALGGVLFDYGLRVLFAVGCVFLVAQIGMALILVKMRKKEKIIYAKPKTSLHAKQ